MTQPKVAIRLGTEGKDQIVRDFREVGDAGDAAANRAARAFEKAANDIESAERRKAAAAAKLVAFSPAGASVSPDRGAYPSTADFRAYQQQQALYRQQAEALRAAIDPAWAAQQRFNAEMAQARTLISAGVITLDEYCAKLRIEQAELDQVRMANDRLNASAGAVRSGVQQLTFQVNDMVTMWAMGAAPMQIFVSQSGQVTQAIGLMTGGAKGLAGFIGGPWGMLIMSGVSVLATLALTSDNTTEALEKVRFASNSVGDAQGILGDVMDLTTGKIKTQSSALLGLAQAQLAVARVQAQSRQADARREAQDAGKLGLTDGLYGIFASNKTLLGSRTTRDLMSSYLGGATDSKSAITTLENLNKAGLITDEVFAKAAASVANFAMEAQNIKSLEAAQRVLDGDASAADRALFAKPGPKPKKAGKSDAEREAERAAREAARIALEQAKERNSWMNSYPVGKAANDNLEAEGKRLKELSDFTAQQRADTAAGTALLNVEWQLRGKSREEIEKAVELRRYQIDIERQMPGLTAAQVQELVKAKEAQLEWAEQVAKTSAFWDDVRSHGENAVSRLFDITSAESWGKRVKGILVDLANEFIRLQAMKALFGSSGGGGGGGGLLGGIIGAIGGFLGGMGGGGGFGGSSSLAPAGTYNAAIGHEYTPAGAMLVGENGPELVNMPRGARVMTASDTRRAMAANSRSMTYAPTWNIDATGADQAALARVEAKLDSMDRNFASRTLSTVSEADDRLFLRFGNGRG